MKSNIVEIKGVVKGGTRIHKVEECDLIFNIYCSVNNFLVQEFPFKQSDDMIAKQFSINQFFYPS